MGRWEVGNKILMLKSVKLHYDMDEDWLESVDQEKWPVSFWEQDKEPIKWQV